MIKKLTVLLLLLTFGFTSVQIFAGNYMTDVYYETGEHNELYLSGDRYYWQGYDATSTNQYKENYLIDFIWDKIYPYATNQSEFDAAVLDFETEVETNGLLLEFIDFGSGAAEFGIYNATSSYPSLPTWQVYNNVDTLEFIKITFNEVNFSNVDYNTFGSGTEDWTEATYHFGGTHSTPLYTYEVNESETSLRLGFYIVPSYESTYYLNITNPSFGHKEFVDNYWQGYTDTTNNVYHVNYLYRYIKDYVEPLASDANEFNAWLPLLLNDWRANGITISLGLNVEVYQAKVFVPAWQDDFLPETFYNIGSGTTSNINIDFVNLSFDGIEYGVEGGEIFADSIIYDFGYRSVEISQLDDFGSQRNPRIGIYVNRSQQNTITFDSNGGSAVSSELVWSGETLSTIPKPTRANYTFIGWTTDTYYSLESNAVFTPEFIDAQGFSSVEDIAEYVDAINGETIFEDDTTLYAIYIPNQYTVTLFSNNGLINGFYRTVEINVFHGYTIEDTLALYEGEKGGYNFLGWFTDLELTVEFNPLQPITEDINLYAKYEDAREPSNNFVEDLLDPFNLNNDVGKLLVFAVIVLFATSSLLLIGLGGMVVLVVNAILFFVFIILGFFNIITTIILTLLFVFGFALVLKGKGD